MTKEIYDQFLEIVKAYQMEVVSENLRDEEEYLYSVLSEIEVENFWEDFETVGDYLDDLRDRQDFEDGGYQEMMFPDVDEDGQDYPEGYNPRDNEAYKTHSQIIKEIMNRCKDILDIEE